MKKGPEEEGHGEERGEGQAEVRDYEDFLVLLYTTRKLFTATNQFQPRVVSPVLSLDTLLFNTLSSRSHLIPVRSYTLYLGDVSPYLQTCVVHRQDLSGPLTGGEQPHPRRFLHQLCGKHCVLEIGSTQCGESKRSLQIV